MPAAPKPLQDCWDNLKIGFVPSSKLEPESLLNPANTRSFQVAASNTAHHLQKASLFYKRDKQDLGLAPRLLDLNKREASGPILLLNQLANKSPWQDPALHQSAFSSTPQQLDDTREAPPQTGIGDWPPS